ncbi:hypothetical protein [Synechococcus sp. MIT S9508]|uniref:hypothetical protein n=1 Tax=Synechococcus sp. MIT S9508 TaxID=1801629 RepID=UPI0007BB55A2|nr:hypothetical protein [Synechococcus sp. MIT S9508]KZR88360.1 hypothetical protein MITS9508_02185 [Synechococcus sp. MIT S9508]
MKNLLVKFLGPLVAIAGVLGLTGSSILWNFQGRTLGLPATILSLLVLALGIFLLRPLQQAPSAETSEIVEDQRSEVTTIASSDENSEVQKSHNSETTEFERNATDSNLLDASNQKKPSLTTAEAIAAQLAAAEADQPVRALVNFAPNALRPGNSIRPNKRAPGKNLSGFRDMASDLFKTN